MNRMHICEHYTLTLHKLPAVNIRAARFVNLTVIIKNYNLRQ